MDVAPGPPRYYEVRPLPPLLLNVLRRCLRRGPFGAFYYGCDEAAVEDATFGCCRGLIAGCGEDIALSVNVAGLSADKVLGSCTSVSFNNALRLYA